MRGFQCLHPLKHDRQDAAETLGRAEAAAAEALAWGAVLGQARQGPRAPGGGEPQGPVRPFAERTLREPPLRLQWRCKRRRCVRRRFQASDVSESDPRSHGAAERKGKERGQNTPRNTRTCGRAEGHVVARSEPRASEEKEKAGGKQGREFGGHRSRAPRGPRVGQRGGRKRHRRCPSDHQAVEERCKGRACPLKKSFIAPELATRYIPIRACTLLPA
mmetsp:Transcript_65953/g.132827  ORF Transcript_65953/g.132827 Transcript_65953/m.132827 type:complete len:218 (+) Transcript_65953:850-1503(+)